LALDVATFLSEPSLPISQLFLWVRFGLQNALEFVHLVSAFLVHKKRGKKIHKKLKNTSEDDVLLRLKAPSYFHVCFPGKVAIFLFFLFFFFFFFIFFFVVVVCVENMKARLVILTGQYDVVCSLTCMRKQCCLDNIPNA
jgi:hypothetical protein